MARSKGTARFAVNFEPTGQTPLDARLLVPTVEDLYTAYADDSNYYQDMVVTVQEDHSQYILIDTAQRTTAAGWKRIDAGAAEQVEIVNDLTTGGTDKALSAEQGKVLDGEITAAKNAVDAYTVNGKEISTNPELNGADVDLSEGYVKAGSYTAPAAGDSIDVAVGKLAKGIEDAAAGGVQSVNGQTGAITIAEGDANGQIKVGTQNVSVHGLGTAAYQNTSAFDAAGSANAVKAEVIGSDDDLSSDDTIKGAKKYAEEQAEASKVTVVNDLTTGGTDDALSAEQGKVLKAQVDAKVASVSAGNGIEVAGTTTPSVSVKRDTTSESFLTVGENGLKLAGVQDAIDTAKSAATQVANQKVASVAAKNAAIEVDSSVATAPKVGLKLSANPGILSIESDGLRATAPAEVPYTGSNAISIVDHAVSLKIKADDKVLSQDSNGLTATLGLKYVSASKKIQLTGIDSEVIAEVDATAFIKDGMVQDVSFEPTTKILTITFNTEAGTEPIEVDLTSLVDTYTAGNGINISGNAVSLVVDPATESFLTVGASGLKLAGVQNAIDSAKSAAISTVVGTDGDQSSADTIKGTKKYVDEKIGAIPAGVQYYSGTISSSASSPQTITATTHKCGTMPQVQCFLDGELVIANVAINASGDVTITWNGSIDSDLTYVIIGK